MGKKRTALLFILSLSFGFLSEYVGVVYGWVFGPYYYSSSMSSLLGIMAIETPFSWALIIYISYRLAAILISGSVNGEIAPSQPKWRAICLTAWLSVISGLCAMNIDMILDPVAVTQGAWTWIGGGSYFGVPLSNFAGWFMVAFICTLVFRITILCTNSSGEGVVAPLNLKLLSALVIGVYLWYLIKHVALSLNLNHPEFALVGIAAMLPLILISLLKLISEKPKSDLP